LAYGKFVQEYRKNAVNGASPVQLVVMLYDGAIRFMENGRYAMEGGDLQRQNDQIQRAQRIVFELMATLNMDKGGEISRNLMSLYTYVIEQLVNANVEDKPEGIDRALKVMRELRESWVEIERRHRMGEIDPSAEVKLAA
jgi:flagellar protein FliS